MPKGFYNKKSGDHQRHVLAGHHMKSWSDQRKVFRSNDRKKTVGVRRETNLRKLPYDSFSENKIGELIVPTQKSMEVRIEEFYDWRKISENMDKIPYGEEKKLPGIDDEDERFEIIEPEKDEKILYLGQAGMVVPYAGSWMSVNMGDKEWTISSRYAKALENVANRHGMELDTRGAEQEFWLVKKKSGKIVKHLEGMPDSQGE